MRLPFTLFFCFALAASAISAAQAPRSNEKTDAVIRVASPAAFKAAAAKAQPGDTLLLAAGDWRDVRLLVSCRGTAAAPITIAAEKPGATRFTGHSTLQLDGEYVVLRGFVWTDGCSEKTAIVDVRGTGHRVTDCAFVRYNPDSIKTRYPWVHLQGRGHRIDHNRFEGQAHSGVTVQVVVGEGDNHHRIDRNHFLNRPLGDGNGFETIQVGQSQDSLKASRSIVEENLFTACDGEIEVISNKSCENTYRYNTFRACAAALTLRHGDRCLVERNAFFGDGKKGATGIRIIGRDHIVRENYLEGVGDSPGGVFSITAGIPDSPLNGYWTADRALVQDNLLWRTTGVAFHVSAGLGSSKRTLLPGEVRLMGNAILPAPDAPAVILLKGDPGTGLAASANAYRAPATLPTSGPLAIFTAGFSPTGPLPDRAAFLARCRPLTPADVGPSW